MGNIGRIVPLKKEYSKNSNNLEACLANLGYTRFPGTVLKLMPAKAPNGKFVTGLDPDALYIKKLPKDAQDAEKARVIALRKELEEATGLDLSPTALYYKNMFDDKMDQFARAALINLSDDEMVFNLDNAYEHITYCWLKHHPQIASSYQAWERGEYPPTTKFYVADDDIEAEISYKKKIAVNQAIVILDKMSVEDRRKVARLLGKPVTDDTKEVYVYNILDTFIKSVDINDGKYKGSNPLGVFMTIASLDAKMLGIRDLIQQAIVYNIYREDSDGTIKEGGQEIAKNSVDLSIELAKSKNQDKLVILDDKVRAKKLAETV